MEKRTEKLSILMPVRNEGANLKMVLKIIDALMETPYEVLVIYDSPDDDSIPIANEMQKKHPQIRPLHNKLGRGVINAIKSGVEAAKGKYMLILPADDMGAVFGIQKMLLEIEKGYDLVSATRYANGGKVVGGAISSRFLSRMANKLFVLFAGSKMTDCTVGIKIFTRDAFQSINFECKPVGWAFAFEMAIKAQMMGLKTSEVPIVSINRFYGGTSTFKLNKWISEYIKWFFWGMRNSGKRVRK
jgi:dolichol-phosphate mannosyltransferase